MRIIKLAQKETEIPMGKVGVEVVFDIETGEQHQEIIRGGKSKCSNKASDWLKDLLATPLEGWGDGGAQSGEGETTEGQIQKTQENIEKNKAKGVKPLIPLTPTKKPGFQIKPPPSQKGQVFTEV